MLQTFPFRIYAGLLSSVAVATSKMKELKLGVVAQLDAAHVTLLCASTLQTGFKAANGSNVVVGCMVKVELPSQSAAKITVRTASQQVTACLSQTLAAQLGP